MKRWPVLILIGGGLALTAWSFAKRRACDCELDRAAAEGDTCCWFSHEFGADEATCARIASAHETFREECDRRCAEVRVAQAAADRPPTGASETQRAALREAYSVAAAACFAAREAHARKVAGLLPPGQGERYLAYVLPRLRGHDHSHAPDASGR